MKAKRVKAFCVVENDNEIFVYSAQMPIYWRKTPAIEYAKVQNQIGNPCEVKPCYITFDKGGKGK
jgi:hypothetical protein